MNKNQLFCFADRYDSADGATGSWSSFRNTPANVLVLNSYICIEYWIVRYSFVNSSQRLLVPNFNSTIFDIQLKVKWIYCAKIAIYLIYKMHMWNWMQSIDEFKCRYMFYHFNILLMVIFGLRTGPIFIAGYNLSISFLIKVKKSMSMFKWKKS